MPILVKQNDTAPAVSATLLDAADEPVNLDGATVRFVMATDTETRTVLVDAAAVVAQSGSGSDGSRGTVVYEWQPGDTSAVGEYIAEFEVTYEGGEVQTFPTDGFVDATVFEDLGGDV